MSRPIKQPLGVILAGGLATRMGGGDKGLLEIGGEPLLQRIIDRIEPQVAAGLSGDLEPGDQRAQTRRVDEFGTAEVDDQPGVTAVDQRV